jgi:hypothetical protein
MINCVTKTHVHAETAGATPITLDDGQHSERKEIA